MPTYQYVCTDCGEPIEVVQKFTDDALTVCPACEGQLRKVFSAVGIVFKGSGFYRNDSRTAANGGDGKPAEPAAKSSESSPKQDSSATESAGATSSSAGNGSSSEGGSQSGSGSSTVNGSRPSDGASNTTAKATPSGSATSD